LRYLNHALYQFCLLAAVIRRFPLIGLIRKHRRKSETVLWLWPSFPTDFFSYFGKSAILHDVALLQAAVQKLDSFQVILGKRIGKTHNRRILFNCTDIHNPYQFQNHSLFLRSLVAALEEQNNICHPPSREISFWEDKRIMYSHLAEAGVPFPKTVTVDTFSDGFSYSKLAAVLGSPFLLKEPFGNHSRGIHSIYDQIEFESAAITIRNRGCCHVSAQQILKIERDARVITIGSNVVQSYWRTRSGGGDRWSSTSTSSGSYVEFGILTPAQEKMFVEFSRKLGIRVAAYDVAFLDEGGEARPMVFEVSSFYLTNPASPAWFGKRPYKDYKAMFRLYTEARAEVVTAHKILWLQSILEEPTLGPLPGPANASSLVV
jgi:glutathione synthase/RimK-type ligase-like ATP-grasp enzyme